MTPSADRGAPERCLRCGGRLLPVIDPAAVRPGSGPVGAELPVLVICHDCHLDKFVEIPPRSHDW